MKEYIWQDSDDGRVSTRKQELIRCKDCKYYHKPEYGFSIGDCTYGSTWFQTNEDGFCDKAKRE